MKLITIAIPTYNRCNSCIATIKNFISQIEKNNFEDEVHIFISDNHSTDSTYEELLKLQAKYPELIEINRNETNLGMGQNFLCCIKNCNTKYLWMPGDDDIYFDNALRDVILTLKKYPSLIYIFLNCYHPATNTKTIKIKKDFFGSLQECLKLCGISSTHISPTIVKTDLIKEIPIDPIAEEWALWQKIIRIQKNGDAYIFNEPRVSFDSNNKNTDDNWMLNKEKKALYFTDLFRFCLTEDNYLLKDIKESILKICLGVINECYRTPPAKKKFNKRLIFWQLFSAILATALIIETCSLYFKN